MASPKNRTKSAAVGASAKAEPQGSQQVRIIGGQWRRSVLRFPAVPGLRPTPDRVRETVFNWLGQDLDGFRCLDLFSGSGAMGLEAASRGAAEVCLVDAERVVCQQLQNHVQRLGATQVRVVQRDALRFLQDQARAYDVVFLDPPFQSQLLPKLWPLLPAWLAPEAKVYIESAAWPELPEAWQVLRQAQAGMVHYGLIALKKQEIAAL